MWRSVVCVAALKMLLAGCTQEYSYRYRVTVEVDTPQGVRTGSSVWETSAWQGSGIPDTAIRSREKGEAVVVDLPGGTLFAAMREPDLGHDYAREIVEEHLALHPVPGLTMGKDWQMNRRSIASNKPSFELYPDEYPLLVRFREQPNSATIEQVDPQNMAAQFGEGVSIRRVTVTVTDEAPEVGPIRDRLPWLSKDVNSDRRMKDKFAPDDWSFPAQVRHGDFARG